MQQVTPMRLDLICLKPLLMFSFLPILNITLAALVNPAGRPMNVMLRSSFHNQVYFPFDQSRDFGELSLAASTTVTVRRNSFNAFQSFYPLH